VTGPAGTGTGLGTQGTANMGTDALWNLVGSVAEPYAESIAFGAMDRYFVRIVNGIRFEPSDEFRFQHDLVAFRCIIRLDGALIDTNAVRTFVNTT
jgi:HK97 family phage major capsid protein